MSTVRTNTSKVVSDASLKAKERSIGHMISQGIRSFVHAKGVFLASSIELKK
jgi:hypothetical protein